MATIYPDTGRRPLDNDRPIEPLAVSPRQACLLLGVGNTRLYELIRDCELVSYHEGRARRITMASIRARIAQLSEPLTEASVQPTRRRLPKHPTRR